MRPNPIRLVIFDCDGVLVDSEPIAMRVLLDAIAGQGRTIPVDEAYQLFLGRSLESISSALGESHGLTLTRSALEEMRHQLFARFRRELRPMPWIVETLEALDVPICVASSSGVERIALSLEVTGLLDRFRDRIFSASMVERGKPAPDLFLHAARAMQVPPEACLVIEDSPAGLRAAQAAGMRVFAFVGGEHAQPAGLAFEMEPLRPDAVFEDMRALAGLLAVQQARAEGRRPNLLAAVDVGTASARAGIIDSTGKFLSYADAPFGMRRPNADIAEHDSEEIWKAVCAALRKAISLGGVLPDEVVGLAFDATCSLVVRDKAGNQQTVSETGESHLDTISWMDHRAQAEAAAVTATGHKVLGSLGGSISPEMQIPKLMWIKRHLPETWAQLGMAFDLSDFLSWKATGSTARSLCTLACKWTYLPQDGGWQTDFLREIGLEDVREKAKLPKEAASVGTDLGTLLPAAAAELGLGSSCRVGMGMIDAHAGALGAASGDIAAIDSPGGHLTLVAGTSSSFMAITRDPRRATGIWGPFPDAVLPGTWLSEAGQSATGGLLEHIMRSHPAGGPPTSALHTSIVQRIAELRSVEGAQFAARLRVLPDFHGNRSPLAEPMSLGAVIGLSLDEGFDGLCALYFRCAVGIAMRDRHILEALQAIGYDIAKVHFVGGHAKNPLLVELYADVSGVTLVESLAIDTTLLGDAMVAAVAAGRYPTLELAAKAMASGRREHQPNLARQRDYDAEYRVFTELTKAVIEIERLAAD